MLLWSTTPRTSAPPSHWHRAHQSKARARQKNKKNPSIIFISHSARCSSMKKYPPEKQNRHRVHEDNSCVRRCKNFFLSLISEAYSAKTSGVVQGWQGFRANKYRIVYHSVRKETCCLRWRRLLKIPFCKATKLHRELENLSYYRQIEIICKF